MRGDRVLLPLDRHACADVTVLEHDGGVTDDEVDGAGDRALSVELLRGQILATAGVLVPVQLAAVQHPPDIFAL
jgi:hypothetical protein